MFSQQKLLFLVDMVLNRSELSLQYIRDNLCQPRSCDHRVFFAELFAQD